MSPLHRDRNRRNARAWAIAALCVAATTPAEAEVQSAMKPAETIVAQPLRRPVGNRHTRPKTIEVHAPSTPAVLIIQLRPLDIIALGADAFGDWDVEPQLAARATSKPGH